MRVYRKWHLKPQNKSCSLIICEGISAGEAEKRAADAFPHYMWGYIGLKKITRFLTHVPSLYVRVYRAKFIQFPIHRRSLIICEGISSLLDLSWNSAMFPHYMWGYIGLSVQEQKRLSVPSLYVRVYRELKPVWKNGQSSLIICEGISWWHYSFKPTGLFPHYMWGYIDLSREIPELTTVPSLYVRVYRNTFKRRQRCCRSLIICEGIS